MPTFVVGMLETRENYAMPTASVGMVPFPSTFHNRNNLANECANSKGRQCNCRPNEEP